MSRFCHACGTAMDPEHSCCPHCRADVPGHPTESVGESPKSIGVAIVLCAVFGTLGIHHFYLGNVLHGLFDLGLAVAAFAFFIAAVTGAGFQLILLAMLLMAVVFIHTIYVFYRLITGEERDGQGRLIVLPGQRA